MPFLVVTLTTISGQLMPGSVPQLPNPALKVCLNEVGYDNVTSEYNNRFANAVNRWCKVYDRALPCVDQLLEDTETEETVRGPADWYFSMVFDKSKANKTTRTMCKSLPIVGNKLPCMRSNVRRALTCVLKMTKTVKQVLLRLYMNNDTTAAVAGKGACL
ncbi:hypothetical protein FSP39_018590 [Pinctada imbricata]|uniref:Uncharacterized protein n=1 Tax=Pinctada imbricata TaxID=66713 RepID=A0AA89BJL7_PINIB|nr:hypothetical protein FSP39_018590 [Pinctada imbricata]